MKTSSCSWSHWRCRTPCPKSYSVPADVLAAPRRALVRRGGEVFDNVFGLLLPAERTRIDLSALHAGLKKLPLRPGILGRIREFGDVARGRDRWRSCGVVPGLGVCEAVVTAHRNAQLGQHKRHSRVVCGDARGSIGGERERVAKVLDSVHPHARRALGPVTFVEVLPFPSGRRGEDRLTRAVILRVHVNRTRQPKVRSLAPRLCQAHSRAQHLAMRGHATQPEQLLQSGNQGQREALDVLPPDEGRNQTSSEEPSDAIRISFEALHVLLLVYAPAAVSALEALVAFPVMRGSLDSTLEVGKGRDVVGLLLRRRVLG